MSLERDLTVVVKTFERPEAVRRLVGSIRRFYPDVPVVVEGQVSSSPVGPADQL